MKINGTLFRENMIELASNNALPGEAPTEVVSRAKEYCRFVLQNQMSSAVLEEWQMRVIDFGPAGDDIDDEIETGRIVS